MPAPASETAGVSTAPFRSFALAAGLATDRDGAVLSSVTVNGVPAPAVFALFVAVTLWVPELVVEVVQL
jgi:hypothetical protein